MITQIDIIIVYYNRIPFKLKLKQNDDNTRINSMLIRENKTRNQAFSVGVFKNL